MTLKNLVRVERFLEENRGQLFSRTEIRDSLQVDWDTLQEILEYLVSQRKILRTTNTQGIQKFGIPL